MMEERRKKCVRNILEVGLAPTQTTFHTEKKKFELFFGVHLTVNLVKRKTKAPHKQFTDDGERDEN
jgi:hypothetical protein